MPRYVALLRGVSPMNAKMPDLVRAFESAGFTDVRTLLSSGNVAFTTRAAKRATLERRAEEAMEASLGRTFGTIVRSSEELQTLVASEPFGGFALPAAAKCVVTFLREPCTKRLALPIEHDGATILKLAGDVAFTAYVPGERPASFMTLIERTFGTEVTTRTLATVEKCARA